MNHHNRYLVFRAPAGARYAAWEIRLGRVDETIDQAFRGRTRVCKLETSLMTLTIYRALYMDLYV